MVGVVVAIALFVGLRSGSRGGPLALEAADVRHVLLAPIDRGVALRGPALRQLRFLVFVAAIVGATAGQLAARRLPHGTVAWAASGAAIAALVVALARRRGDDGGRAPAAPMGGERPRVRAPRRGPCSTRSA